MSISTVTSEALQLKLRQLLPSQQGFGEDLSASNTIIPIIDLTRSAEGSDVPETLQTALAYGSQTAFEVSNTSTEIINTTGFWRVVGVSSVEQSSTQLEAKFIMSDGATPKDVWQHIAPQSGSPDSYTSIQFDLVFFVVAGVTINVSSNNTSTVVSGSSRQIADINGNLINPVGFTPQ